MCSKIIIFAKKLANYTQIAVILIISNLENGISSVVTYQNPTLSALSMSHWWIVPFRHSLSVDHTSQNKTSYWVPRCLVNKRYVCNNLFEISFFVLWQYFAFLIHCLIWIFKSLLSYILHTSVCVLHYLFTWTHRTMWFSK